MHQNKSFICLKKSVSNGVEIKGDTHFYQGYEISPDKGGIFLKWNFENETFILQNDRFGMYPAFYYQNDGQFILSTSLDHLASLLSAEELSLDYEGLSVFLRIGWFIGDHTAFKKIKAIPPGCTITWKDGSLSVETKEKPTVAPFTGTRSEAIETFTKLFEESMTDCLAQTKGDITIPISGGRDSRHILFELMKQHNAPDMTVTLKHIPPRPNGDFAAASIITDTLKLKHTTIEQPNYLFENEWHKNILNNFCSIEHTWLMPMVNFFHDHQVNTIYDGITGDVFIDGFCPSRQEYDQIVATEETVADFFLQKHAIIKVLDNNVLEKSIIEKCSYTLASASFAKEIRKYQDTNDVLSSFYFWNRTRRAIGSYTYGMLGFMENIYAPFLGHKLFDFFLSITPDLIYPNEIHTEMIAKAYPKYANIPFAEMIDTSYEKQTPLPSIRRDVFKTLFRILTSRGQIINKKKAIVRLIEAFITGKRRTYDYAGGLHLIYLLQLQSLKDRPK